MEPNDPEEPEKPEDPEEPEAQAQTQTPAPAAPAAVTCLKGQNSKGGFFHRQNRGCIRPVVSYQAGCNVVDVELLKQVSKCVARALSAGAVLTSAQTEAVTRGH